MTLGYAFLERLQQHHICRWPETTSPFYAYLGSKLIVLLELGHSAALFTPAFTVGSWLTLYEPGATIVAVCVLWPSLCRPGGFLPFISVEAALSSGIDPLP